MTSAAPAPRVYMLTETYRPEIGGGERQAALLSAGLAQRRCTVTLLTRRSRRGLPRHESEGSVRIRRLSPAGPGRLRKWLLLPPVLLLLLARWRDYDVVLVSGFRLLGVSAMLAAIVTRKPTVLKADSSGEMSGEYFRTGLRSLGLSPEGGLARFFLARRNALLRRADRFVCLSWEMRDEFITAGVTADQVVHIPNGVDLERFRPATAEERSALRRQQALPDGPVVIYTGRLVRYKGLRELLEAWRLITGHYRDACLVLVGEGGGDQQACEEELRESVETHNLSKSVRFTGAVDNVEDWLRAADIFVFPTHDEAFGLSLVEAMACGLAAISTRVGGLADIVRDGENAVAVPPSSPARLAEALRSLLDDPGYRDRLGSAAREDARTHHAVDVVCDAYGNLLAGLTSERRGRAK
ncbi:glycosyltransferase family 4 protein [Thioalkalivibrio sp.]|uniref:glycosyltransferase family 4 protein n=1 Tax=Thioalkalivibrio sp. TaxID=2093813 RepID=UPI0035699FE4